jgi:hypothetical protein
MNDEYLHLEQLRLNALEALTVYFNNGGDPNNKNNEGTTAFESLISVSGYDVELIDTLLSNTVVSEETIKELQTKYPNDQTFLSFIKRYHVDIKEPEFD